MGARTLAIEEQIFKQGDAMLSALRAKSSLREILKEGPSVQWNESEA